MLEVNARTIEGNGGTVSLQLTHTSTTAGLLEVVVTDAAGHETDRRAYADSREALAHYQHTFAYADGPDLPTTNADADDAHVAERVAEYVS